MTSTPCLSSSSSSFPSRTPSPTGGGTTNAPFTPSPPTSTSTPSTTRDPLTSHWLSSTGKWSLTPNPPPDRPRTGHCRSPSTPSTMPLPLSNVRRRDDQPPPVLRHLSPTETHTHPFLSSRTPLKSTCDVHRILTSLSLPRQCRHPDTTHRPHDDSRLPNVHVRRSLQHCVPNAPSALHQSTLHCHVLHRDHRHSPPNRNTRLTLRQYHSLLNGPIPSRAPRYRHNKPYVGRTFHPPPLCRPTRLNPARPRRRDTNFRHHCHSQSLTRQQPHKARQQYQLLRSL